MNSRYARDRRSQLETRAQLPLLDRLIDDAPDVVRDPPVSAAETAAILRRSVRRDLEALLNAHRRWRSWPEDYRELAVSPLGYGISDFSAGAFNERSQRDQLRARIERTIRHFEPRLAQVRVVLVDGDNTLDATMRLRIEGLLKIQPAPEPIVFDTMVDAATAEIRVSTNSSDATRADNV